MGYSPPNNVQNRQISRQYRWLSVQQGERKVVCLTKFSDLSQVPRSCAHLCNSTPYTEDYVRRHIPATRDPLLSSCLESLPADSLLVCCQRHRSSTCSVKWRGQLEKNWAPSILAIKNISCHFIRTDTLDRQNCSQDLTATTYSLHSPWLTRHCQNVQPTQH
jgi:hypothetical protein